MGLSGLVVDPSSYWFVLVPSQTPKTTLGDSRSCWEWVWVYEALLVYTGSPPTPTHPSPHLGTPVGTGVAGQDPEAELAFAGALLSHDFSNFSAWHHLLQLLAPARNSSKKDAGVLPPKRLKEGKGFPIKIPRFCRIPQIFQPLPHLCGR